MKIYSNSSSSFQSDNCIALGVIGFYMFILLVSSTVFNSISMGIFYRAKLFTPINFFMMTLLSLNLVATFIESPYMIYNAYNCKVIENEIECIINGFAMYFVGNFQTYLLVAISIERYLMISNLINSKSITYKACFITIVVCIFLSAIWAFFPLVGWSYYSTEGIKMSCGVEWQDHSLNVMSYNISIFIFAFFLPLVLIAIANYKTIKIVCSQLTLNPVNSYYF
jgi:hypothetical protein